MRCKINIKFLTTLLIFIAMPVLSLPSKADSLLSLLQDLESKRFLMGFDTEVREQLESYEKDIDRYPQSIQAHYFLLYQDALVRNDKLQGSLEARAKLVNLSEGGGVPASYLLYSEMLLGLAYVHLSRGEESKVVLMETIDKSLKSEYYKIAFHSLLILGDVYSIEKKFAKSFSSYQKSQSILKTELLSVGNERQYFAWQAELNYRVGYVYRHMWRDQESIKYFKRALYFDKKIENTRNIKFDLIQIGNAYLRLEVFDKAEKYFSKLEDILTNSKVPDEGRMLDFAGSMIRLKVKSRKLQESKKYIEMATSVKGKVQSASVRVRYLLALAYYLNSTGMHEEAIFKCHAIEKMATKMNWAEYGNEVINLSAQAHYSLGRFKESSLLFERMHKSYLERSGYIRLMAGEVERARFDFESEALKVERLLQDNNIKALALESEKSKLNVSILVLLLALLLIFSLGSIVFFAMRNAKKLKVLANHDALTGVLNRRAILEWGEDRVNNHNKLSLLLVDVDHFKRVNDSFGHAKGDSVLKYITQVASSFCNQNINFGRVGGEEFLFVIDNMEAMEALMLGRKFSEKLKLQSVDGIPAPTVSIGHVFQSSPDGPDDLNTLFEKADEALYRAKSSGRDCIRQYDLTFGEKPRINVSQAASSNNIEGAKAKNVTA